MLQPVDAACRNKPSVLGFLGRNEAELSRLRILSHEHTVLIGELLPCCFDGRGGFTRLKADALSSVWGSADSEVGLGQLDAVGCEAACFLVLAAGNHEAHLGELVLASLLVFAVLGVSGFNVRVENLVESFGPSVLGTFLSFGSPAVSSVTLTRGGGYCKLHVKLGFWVKLKRVELTATNGFLVGFPMLQPSQSLRRFSFSLRVLVFSNLAP